MRAGKYAPATLDYDEEEIERITAASYEHDRHMLAALGAPCDPDVPPERNLVCIQKARE